MAVANDVLTVFRNALSEIYQSITGSFGGKSSPSSRFLTAILLLVAIGYGSLRVYRWQIASREAKAQKVFSQAMQIYEQAQRKPEKWEDVVNALALGYEQHRSSNLAPFFIFFQGQAMAEQNKMPEAITLTESGLEKLDKENPFFGFYQTKLALMKIDSDDKKVQAEGIKDLEACGKDEASSARDMALYYLGLHYWDNNEVNKAQESWNALLALKVEDKEAQSPFVEMAQEKMKFAN